MKKVSGQLAKQLAHLRNLRDEDIDLSDIPDTADWSKAVVGKFYRPTKQSLTVRIDTDVLAWLKSQGKGYQTRINSYLREAMYRTAKRPRSATPRRRRSAS